MWSGLSKEQYVDKLVECKTAIDELNWSHSLWPKENKSPKPLFKDMVDKQELLNSINNRLKMQAVLFDKFNIEITPTMLQNDLNRMAVNTKNAKRLKQLFSLLGNNPKTITECVSKPFLVKKTFEHHYNYSKDIHAEIRSIAENDLVKYFKSGNVEDTTAQSHRITYKLKSGKQNNLDKDQGEEAIIWLGAEEFNQKTQQFTSKKLQEKEHSFIFTEILKSSEQSMEVRVLQWKKQKLNTWFKSQPQTEHTLIQETVKFSLPVINGSNITFNNKSSVGNTWDVQAFIPDGRHFHSAVWTGSEMIVWGGETSSGLSTNTGARYNPITDTWIATSVGADVPSSRKFFSAVWTGSEMIVWGGWSGLSGVNQSYNNGGRYNPTTDSWIATSLISAPSVRSRHTAIWTGVEMVVWGGNGQFTGGRYNPITDSWLATNTTGAPLGRTSYTAIWADNVMIIWGGFGSSNYQNTGGRYDPATDTWEGVSTIDVPIGRSSHSAVWTGTEMIVWGGEKFQGYTDTGGHYNPVTNTWSATGIGGTVPTARKNHAAIWTGTEMIIWSGRGGGGTGSRYDRATGIWADIDSGQASPTAWEYHSSVWTGSEMIVWGGEYDNSSGGRYNPTTDSWIATSTRGETPGSRHLHSSIWTGNEMIVWGGYDSGYLNTGGRYNPTTDNWVSTYLYQGNPIARQSHTAIWTGSRMIIWGGYTYSGGDVYLKTGGSYNVSTDRWWSVDSLGLDVPVGREGHTATWTGSEMIIWGGHDNSNNLNTGGRYNPSSNTWLSTDTAGAPAARDNHTSVWSGTEMIVWGGSSLNTGGRYDPTTDNWIATTTTSAPIGRQYHTAVWDGDEMIVWGGDNGGSLNTGGLYNPVANSWVATDPVGPPDERINHTAIWTGSEMIIWGGSDGSTYLNTGGRYNSDTNSWLATTTTNAPSIRDNHTAIWTGLKMIVFAGYDAASLNSMGLYNPHNTYTIGGNVTGLTGSQVYLRNNLTDSLQIINNGTFEFETELLEGSDYDVTVFSNPQHQTCSVTNASGSNINANVTNVEVDCQDTYYTLGVTVSGLADTNSVEFYNDGGDSLTVTENGSFDFNTQVLKNTSYSVTVNTQPTTPSQICTVYSATGNMYTDINLDVVCLTRKYFIDVSVTGLISGSTIELTTNGQTLELTGDFLGEDMGYFANAIESGISYAVLLTAQPTSPNQICTITGGNSGNNNGSGTIIDDHVAIAVNCVTTKYSIEVTVTGLDSANSIQLGVDLYPFPDQYLFFTGDGTASFASDIDDGTDYIVYLNSSQPTSPNQSCTVTGGNGGNDNGFGTIAGSDVAIAVNCVYIKYTISVEVTGLDASNSIEVSTNGQTLEFTTNTTQNFDTLDDGTSYAVISTQPTSPTQECTITGGNSGSDDGSGVLNGTDVTITVNCVTSKYYIGVTVTGLEANNFIILTTNSQILAFSENTSANFATALEDGTPYAVLLLSQPTDPNQVCTITGGNSGANDGSGILAGADAAIVVECITNSYFIGGTVSGLLSGNYMVIQNNAGDDKTINFNGAYIFDTPITDGQDYNVVIDLPAENPIQPCVISNNSDTLAGADVDDVDITCEVGDDLIYRHGFEIGLPNI
jgi:N-acetylneuraminic acid mutarotase